MSINEPQADRNTGKFIPDIVPRAQSKYVHYKYWFGVNANSHRHKTVFIGLHSNK